jgi:hypothetical protein
MREAMEVLGEVEISVGPPRIPHSPRVQQVES